MQFKGKLSKPASKNKFLGKCISFVVFQHVSWLRLARCSPWFLETSWFCFTPITSTWQRSTGTQSSVQARPSMRLTAAGSAFLYYDGPTVAAFIWGSKSTRRYSELAEAYELSSNSDVLKWAVSSSQALTALYSENAMHILYCWKDSTAAGCFWFKKITGLAKSVADPTLWNRQMFNIVFGE